MGAFATSYIPTLASTATRNADSASITTLTPWFNAAAGTLNVAYQAIAGLNQDISMFTAGAPFTASLGMYAAVNDTQIAGWSRVGGITQANPTSSAVVARALHKAAFAYATSDFAISANGGTVGTTASGTLPTVDRLIMGANGIAGTTMGMWLQSIRYYPTRLPNASLQSITA